MSEGRDINQLIESLWLSSFSTKRDQCKKRTITALADMHQTAAEVHSLAWKQQDTALWSKTTAADSPRSCFTLATYIAKNKRSGDNFSGLMSS